MDTVTSVDTAVAGRRSDTVPAALEASVRAHLDGLRATVDVAAMRDHFAEHGYVKLPRLVPADVYARVDDEIHRLVDQAGRRIELEIAETGGTPRRMRTISRTDIHEGSPTVPSLYRSPSLQGFLAEIAGEALYECPWDHEQYIAISQSEPGDTHGWHWGDYAFTVIWILEAPEDPSVGGALQTIPHTAWDKQDPQLERYLASREPETWSHATGEAYFLRSDTTLHRTVPLSARSRRTILNTCWASLDNIERPTSHETMQGMFSRTS